MKWPYRKLGEVCKFQGGSQPPKSQFISQPADGYIRLLQIRDFKSDTKAIYVPESTKNRVCAEDDIMLARYGASVGQIHRGKAGAYNVALIKTTPDTDLLDKDFFYLYLLSNNFQKPLFSVAERSAQAGFSKADISPFLIPLPPIPEQQRIVAILDQAFADIEKARANAEKNLKNARELFDSYLNQVFSQRGEGWVEKLLGEIAEFKNGLNFSQSSKGETVKIVGVKDFKSNFVVPSKQLDTIQIDGNLPSSYELKQHDIVTVRSNGNKRLIGRCLLVGAITDKTSFSGFTIRIRLTSSALDSGFLAYYLKSAATHEMLINAGDGANISNLNQKILTSLPVAWPGIELQLQLVLNIKKIESESRMLQIACEKKLASLDELKKSLLQKAFSGELTKTEGMVA